MFEDEGVVDVPRRVLAVRDRTGDRHRADLVLRLVQRGHFVRAARERSVERTHQEIGSGPEEARPGDLAFHQYSATVMPWQCIIIDGAPLPGNLCGDDRTLDTDRDCVKFNDKSPVRLRHRT
ncbi:hypothetical protein [Amycolatopsis sp. MEPSY49]|uniref:hypothetical protein n=1 Tax=Amycolatopsis sp. MEPSY49 TaxID=3151600 RepID=UPI003EF64044